MKTAKLPKLLSSKIYKTGQTRGADDDVIFQNRVNRNNTVLIPHSFYETCKNAPDNNGKYENSFIVLVNPEEYFTNKTFPVKLKKQGLEIGKNALLFYYSREQWSKFPPANMSPAESRTSPLGGEYVARVPATTSSSDKKIQHGFASSQLKGAGIRVYEYASQQTIRLCQIQLKYIYWQCFDSEEVSRQEGMTKEQVFERRKYIQQEVLMLRLQDKTRLVEARILNIQGKAICPLCLEEISANGFFNKVKQAEGREVSDLTVTQLNLFHIQELRIGQFNHRPYNLGWGHHHCNVVVKDSGIDDNSLDILRKL